MTKSTKIISLRGTVAQNVLKYRTALNVSQEELAVKAGFHRTYISQIERELANLTLDNIEKLSNALGVEAKLLFVRPRVITVNS